MAFSQTETQALLNLKGVGKTVVKRLEEIGIDSFAELKTYTAEEIIETIASMMRSNCWKNSPQAKAAINAVIELAKHHEV